MGNWISVQERLPKAQENVLFVGTFDNERSLCYGYKELDDNESGLWYDRATTDCDGDYLDVYGVTHWMPLPELPEGA